jgi:hypothetical protein
MNAPRPNTSPVAVASRQILPGLYALAPLLILGCMARTPLRARTQTSSEPEETGGATSETTGAAGASGWNTAGVAGAGGAESAGGSLATGGSVDTGGAAAGAVAGAVAEGGSSLAAGMTAISTSGNTVGGTSTIGGTAAIKGGTSSGGSKATGGTAATGGTKSTGGATATGGSKATSSRDGGVSPDGAAPLGTPVISDSGYVQVSAGTTVLAGFVSSSEGGSGSTISLTYGPSSFCASGTVGKNSTYNCWATAGFAVNQSQTGASGSSSSLALTGSTITVSYVNKGGSQLELQLYDGSDYWCSYLSASTTPTSETIPFSKFNTKCWDGSGTAFVSGTPITAVDLVVPGSAVAATPFDFCFLGMTVQ